VDSICTVVLIVKQLYIDTREPIMIKTNRKSILYPDYIAKSVLELRPEELKNAGITHLALDVDETLVPRAYNKLAKNYIAFLESLEKKGFVLMIGSNSRRDFGEIVRHFNAQIVKPTPTSFKPFKSYFKKIIKAAGTDPKHVAMVGDKWVNDVIGANRAGLNTILVEPYARRQRWHHKLYFRRALKNAK
jgi:HAD superfamily phosphatase (TIGR01668 family)